jgi:LmbE family N-acetylglucosaminyl deacetylase
MTHWLYVSPHLDDAVLSCGGTIAARAAAGDRVTVATVFTRAAGGERALYEERRREDRRAARLLGFEALHLGFPDAPFRSPSYCDFESIVYSDPSSGEAAAVTEAVAGELRRLLARRLPDRLVLPLGAGGHIDHQVTFNACASLESPAPAAYYEDRPYAFVPGAVSRRWLQVGGSPVETPSPPSPADGRPLRADWSDLPFLANYMANDAESARCMERLRAEEKNLTGAQRTADCWSWRGAVYRRSPTRLERNARAALARGIAAYASQLGDLFFNSPAGGDGGAIDAREDERLIGRVYGRHAALPETQGWYEAAWVRQKA